MNVFKRITSSQVREQPSFNKRCVTDLFNDMARSWMLSTHINPAWSAVMAILSPPFFARPLALRINWSYQASMFTILIQTKANTDLMSDSVHFEPTSIPKSLNVFHDPATVLAGSFTSISPNQHELIAMSNTARNLLPSNNDNHILDQITKPELKGLPTRYRSGVGWF